jgi:hypothetical protein
MPYHPDNRKWLTSKAGRAAEVRFNNFTKTWLVKRTRFERMIAALADEFGSVQVTQFGASQTRCVPACWDEGNPERVWDCICSCAGSNHGSGHPLSKEVAPGLSVDTEYTQNTYVVHR